jgi:hypothetical protein
MTHGSRQKLQNISARQRKNPRQHSFMLTSQQLAAECRMQTQTLVHDHTTTTTAPPKCQPQPPSQSKQLVD